MNVLNRIGILLILTGLWLNVWAQEPPADRFAAANAAYENERYEQAVERYQSLLDEGFTSASLHYNLGNACYQLNRPGPAILHFEKALRLDPANEQIAHNLNLARSRIVDNPAAVSDFALLEQAKRFFRIRSSTFWAWGSLGAIWLALLAGLGFYRSASPTQRRWAFFGGITLCVLSLVCLGLSLQKRSIEEDSGEAIVMLPTVPLRDAPNGVQELQVLKEGFKVRITDQVNEWVEVEIDNLDASKTSGWLPQNAVEKI